MFLNRWFLNMRFEIVFIFDLKLHMIEHAFGPVKMNMELDKNNAFHMWFTVRLRFVYVLFTFTFHLFFIYVSIVQVAGHTREVLTISR